LLALPRLAGANLTPLLALPRLTDTNLTPLLALPRLTDMNLTPLLALPRLTDMNLTLLLALPRLTDTNLTQLLALPRLTDTKLTPLLALPRLAGANLTPRINICEQLAHMDTFRKIFRILRWQIAQRLTRIAEFLHVFSRQLLGIIKDIWPKRLHKLGTRELAFFERITSFATTGPVEIVQNILVVLDTISVFFSVLLSVFLYEEGFAEYSSGFLAKNMLAFTLLYLAILLPILPRVNTPALHYVAPLAAVCLGTVLYFPLMILIGQLEHLSKIIPIINIFVCAFLMVLHRCLTWYCVSMLASRHIDESVGYPAEKAVLVGTYDSVRDFFADGHFILYKEFDIVAVVTEKNYSSGSTINNVPIIGFLGSFPNLLMRNRVESYFKCILVISEGIGLPNLKKIEYLAGRASVPLLQIFVDHGSSKKGRFANI
jgi:hypothetical protein